jgi:hypothetical protein
MLVIFKNSGLKEHHHPEKVLAHKKILDILAIFQRRKMVWSFSLCGVFLIFFKEHLPPA